MAHGVFATASGSGARRGAHCTAMATVEARAADGECVWSGSSVVADGVPAGAQADGVAPDRGVEAAGALAGGVCRDRAGRGRGAGWSASMSSAVVTWGAARCLG